MGNFAQVQVAEHSILPRSRLMAAGHSSLVSSSSLVNVLLGVPMVAKLSSRTHSDPGQDAQTAVHKLTLPSQKGVQPQLLLHLHDGLPLTAAVTLPFQDQAEHSPTHCCQLHQQLLPGLDVGVQLLHTVTRWVPLTPHCSTTRTRWPAPPPP